MDKNLLVQIFVPTRSGEGNIATGYPVFKNRILTARHVLFPPDRDEAASIEVRWYHQTGVTRQWRPINGIAWPGSEDCDAALIDCKFPEGCETWGMLSEEKPIPFTRWESEGFAKAGQKNARSRRPVGLQGNVFSMADTDREFELGADYAAERPDYWQGVSGSPVFVNGKIIGVIVFCPQNFDAERLRATPVWQLLQKPEFRLAIGYDDRIARLRRARQKVIHALEQSPDAMKALADELDVSRHPDPKPWAEALADKLLDLGVAPFIQKTKKAHRALMDLDKRTDAEAICIVVHWVIPAIFDEGVVQAIRTRKSEPWAALVSFPVVTKTVAEIIMAGVDRRRPVLFRSPSQGEVFPEGKLSLPMPPEGGFHDDVEHFQQAWHAHLINKFADKDFRTRFKPETLIKHVSNRLTEFADDGQSYYFICPTATGSNRQRWELLIRELKTQYPSIVFIELSADDELFLQETEMFGPLCDLLIPPVGKPP
jgi:hypothetical protein